MAITTIRTPSDYMSEATYVYDLAKTSQYFDKSVYNALANAGEDDKLRSYMYAMAGAKDKTPVAFDKQDYEYLKPEDRALYMQTVLYEKPDSEIYKNVMNYLDSAVQAEIDKEAFQSLSEFHRTMSTIGGVIGNTLNSVYGMIENIVDAAILLVGGIGTGFGAWDDGWEGVKKAAAFDLTGTGAIQEALDEFNYKNTYIGKNKVVTAINDVAGSIGRLAINFIPYVGPFIYWASTAGSFATEALNAKPDIDFWSLLGYTALGTGIAFGVEKLSAGIGKALGKGGSFIDDLTGVASKKATKAASQSWVSRVLGDTLSEGLEESIEEFADTVLWNAVIAQGNSALHKNYSFSEILYAGIVGGLAGGIMSGGRVMTTSKKVLTSDGRVVTAKYAKKNDLLVVEKFNKSQTMNINDQLAALQSAVSTSAVADLKSQHPDVKTEQELAELYPKQYEKAVEKDKKIAKDITEAVMNLAKIHSILGDEEFKKVAELANATYEQVQSMADKYVSTITGKTKENRAVEAKVKAMYSDDVSFTVSDSLTPEMKRLVQNLWNKFGIKAYVGDVGALPGKNQKMALTISQNEIIFDKNIFGEMSEQDILNKVVKEELVHTLQFAGNIITPRMLLRVQQAMGELGQDTSKLKLGQEYENESGLTKLTEAQAKAVAEVLLFDKVTVSKMFYSEYSTFNKLYKFLAKTKRKIEESKELRSQKGKLKYNTLLKSMKMHRDIAAEKLGNIENVEQYSKEFELTPQETEQLIAAYIEDPNVGPIEGFIQEAAFAVEKSPEEMFDEKLKQLAKDEKEFETQAIGYLNEYLTDAKIRISKQNNTFYAFQAYENKRKTPTRLLEENSLQSLVTKLKEQGFIDDDVTAQLDAMAEGESIETTVKTESSGQDRFIFGGEYTEDTSTLAETPVADKKVPKKNRNKATFKYSTTSIFDYLDEEMTPEQRADTIQKAVDQENEVLDILEDQKKTVSKAQAEGIKGLCTDLLPSEYQGDINNHKFVSWSNDVYDEHSDVFAELTFEDFVALKNYFAVRIGSDPVYGTALNALIRYGYLKRNDQFKNNKEYMKTLYAQYVSFGAQTISLTSSDYETSLKNFMRQLATEHGINDIPIDKKFFEMLLPKDVSIEQFTAQLDTEIEDLKKKSKNTKDPLDKLDLARQIAYKEGMKNMIADNDIAAAIDYRIKEQLESGENITDTLNKQAIVYNAIIEEIITHTNFNELGNFQYSSKKVPLSKNMDKIRKFFMGLESFRYLMMLSNPATAIKNFASNSLVFAQSFIEDAVLKFYEKRNVMSEATQGKYTGNYDKNFKDFVRETYFEQIKAHSKGDKWTSTELERLQQQYAEARDPLKKTKILSKLQKLEKKALSDALFTSRRTLLNLTNTLAGSSDLILSQCIDFLKSKYHPKDVKWTDAKFDKSEAGIKAMQDKLIETMEKTNPDAANLLKSAIAGDKVSTLKLAQQLKLDLVAADLSNPNTIYYNATKRANKLFFKVDSVLTKTMRYLNQKNPAAGYVLRHIVPFVRVAAGTTSYVLDRSPVGLIKGIVGMFKNKHKWAYQMRNEIDKHYKAWFMEGKKGKFNNEEYISFLESLNGEEGALVRQALAGDDKATRTLFQKMVARGEVPAEAIGSDNIFARAEVLENFSHGTVGTALMIAGVLLGIVLDLEYDDDEDYMGPVLKVGDVKISLSDVSPFSTVFTMGAMLTSENVDDKFDAMWKVFADSTILSTFDSALSYSDGVWDYTKNQSINIATQYIPAFSKALVKLGSNKKDKGTTYGKKLVNSVLANTFIGNWLVPNKIDPYTGEPKKYYDSGWLIGLADWLLPIGLHVSEKSNFEMEAEKFGAETTGLSGTFKINDTTIKLTGKDKEKYAAYKAKYINERFDKIVNGNEKVTIKDEKTGKYKTVKYSALTKEEKQRVLKNLYSTGSTITKIQYWLDQGNSYYVTDRDQYYEYRKLFGNSANIYYKNKWSGSKFVEG
jgi:hypothetical protein